MTKTGARSLAECMLIQAVAAGQDDDLVVKMIKSHLGNLEKKNYPAIARDLKQPLDEIYEAALKHGLPRITAKRAPRSGN